MCLSSFSVLLHIYLGVELQSHVVILYFVFWGSSCFHSELCHFTLLPARCRVSISCQHLFSYYYCYPNIFEPSYVVGFHFPADKLCWVSFHIMLLGHLFIFFGEMFIQVLEPFLKLICLPSHYLVTGFLYIFGINLLSGMSFANIFSLSVVVMLPLLIFLKMCFAQNFKVWWSWPCFFLLLLVILVSHLRIHLS